MSISRMGYERELCWTFLSEILFGNMIIPRVPDIHARGAVDLPPAGSGDHKSREENAHRQWPGAPRLSLPCRSVNDAPVHLYVDLPELLGHAEHFMKRHMKRHAQQGDQSGMRVASRCVSFYSSFYSVSFYSSFYSGRHQTASTLRKRMRSLFAPTDEFVGVCGCLDSLCFGYDRGRRSPSAFGDLGLPWV
jgi:hypothetical protein